MGVVLSPVVDRFASIRNAREPMQIQTVLSELAVEAFDQGVLSWLTWLIEAQGGLAFLKRKEYSLNCKGKSNAQQR